MKKFIFGLSFIFLSVVLFAQAPVGIDDAISKSAYDVSQWVDKTEGNINRRGLIINGFINTSRSLSDYIMPRLRAELQRNGINYVDRERLPEAQKILLDDYNTRRISNASAVPGSELIAVRFIIYVKCEDKGNYYDFSLDILDSQTHSAYISPFSVKKDSHIKNITKNDKKSDLRLLTGFGNIFFGLGSIFLDGDMGGFWITAGELAAGGLILYEIYGMKYHDTLAGWLGPIGVGCGVAAIIGGFARPYIYSRNQGIAEIADNVHIAVIPSNDKPLAVSLSYKIKF